MYIIIADVSAQIIILNAKCLTVSDWQIVFVAFTCLRLGKPSNCNKNVRRIR